MIGDGEITRTNYFLDVLNICKGTHTGCGWICFKMPNMSLNTRYCKNFTQQNQQFFAILSLTSQIGRHLHREGAEARMLN
jgi:hypothetical protein